MKLFDYHTHTTRSRHSTGSMEDYVLAAKRAGLAEMGFSDHMPMPKPRLKTWPYNMAEGDFPSYVAETLDLKRKYPELPIRLGIEADFFPECVDSLKAFLASAPFDYAIGSVHFL